MSRRACTLKFMIAFTARRLVHNVWFMRLYAGIACVILLGTTAGWAWSAARLQQANADQLVDSFLFKDLQTFHGAVFPSAHTQLIKWPLFWLLARLHFSPTAYTVLTTVLAVVTVAAMAYMLYRVARRPLVFGVLCLLLAAVLLLVPVYVFDGVVTTPLSLAMLAGRNIEYVIFVAVLAVYARPALRWRSWQIIMATVALCLLMASDQLFLWYSAGGAVLCVVIGRLFGWRLFSATAWRWLIGSALAWIGASFIAVILNHSFTHVTNYALGVQTVHNAYSVGQGFWNLLRVVGLNFGLTARDGWPTTPALLINCLTVILTARAIVWLFGRLRTLQHSESKAYPATAYLLGGMLLATTTVAFGLFMCTNQAELSNARYETIALISGFVVLAAWMRSKLWPSRPLLIFSCLGILAIGTGFVGTLRYTNRLAGTTLQARNEQIATALQAHRAAYLVGSYWRVFPVRLLTLHAEQQIVPLEGCLQPTLTLTSDVWRPDLRVHSFAYLLSETSTNLPVLPCRKQLILHQYGQPTSILRISGTSTRPTEELLFYDNGAADPRHFIR